MNISFFVSPLTQFQTTIADLIREGYEKQQLLVAPPLTASRDENIGGIATVASLAEITPQACIDEINELMAANPTANEYVFLGFGLSLYIEEIMQSFPAAKVYFCRSNLPVARIESRENKKYLQESKKTGIPIAELKAANGNCKLALAEKVSSLGTPYVLLRELLSTELSWIDAANSDVIDSYNFIHTDKVEDCCEIAIYTPPAV